MVITLERNCAVFTSCLKLFIERATLKVVVQDYLGCSKHVSKSKPPFVYLEFPC